MPFLVVIPYDFYRVSNYCTGRALTKDLISFIAADFIHYFSCMIATNCVKQLRLLRDFSLVQVIYWAALFRGLNLKWNDSLQDVVTLMLDG